MTPDKRTAKAKNADTGKSKPKSAAEAPASESKIGLVVKPKTKAAEAKTAEPSAAKSKARPAVAPKPKSATESKAKPAVKAKAKSKPETKATPKTKVNAKAKPKTKAKSKPKAKPSKGKRAKAASSDSTEQLPEVTPEPESPTHITTWGGVPVAADVRTPQDHLNAIQPMQQQLREPATFADWVNQGIENEPSLGWEKKLKERWAKRKNKS